MPEIYTRLLAQIDKIPVFDNHGHPGFANDPDVDAMQIPARSSAPFRLRDDNDEMLGAAIENRTRAFLDRRILQRDAGDAGKDMERDPH